MAEHKKNWKTKAPPADLVAFLAKAEASKKRPSARVAALKATESLDAVDAEEESEEDSDGGGSEEGDEDKNAAEEGGKKKQPSQKKPRAATVAEGHVDEELLRKEAAGKVWEKHHSSAVGLLTEATLSKRAREVSEEGEEEEGAPVRKKVVYIGGKALSERPAYYGKAAEELSMEDILALLESKNKTPAARETPRTGTASNSSALDTSGGTRSSSSAVMESPEKDVGGALSKALRKAKKLESKAAELRKKATNTATTTSTTATDDKSASADPTLAKEQGKSQPKRVRDKLLPLQVEIGRNLATSGENG
jgi:hypothetical protein